MRRAPLIAILVAGCSSGPTTDVDACSKPSVVPAAVAGFPPRPCDTPTGTTRWFALTQWKIGVTNKNTGKLDPSAWMDFGFDLDGRITTSDDSKNSTNSCKRAEGSLTKVLQDGLVGRDNNFGQHVLALLRSLSSNAEVIANQNMTAPRRAMVLELSNATSADNARVPGVLHVGAENIAFADGYVVDGYWLSSDVGTGSFSMRGLLTDDVALTLAGGIVAMKMDGSNGTIAGAVSADALKSAASSVLRHFGACPSTDPASVEQLGLTITESADLVLGAPQFQDTTKTCDAVSIGLGFVAKEMSAPSAFPAAMPDPDPCAM